VFSAAIIPKGGEMSSVFPGPSGINTAHGSGINLTVSGLNKLPDNSYMDYTDGNNKRPRSLQSSPNSVISSSQKSDRQQFLKKKNQLLPPKGTKAKKLIHPHISDLAIPIEKETQRFDEDDQYVPRGLSKTSRRFPLACTGPFKIFISSNNPNTPLYRLHPNGLGKKNLHKIEGFHSLTNLGNRSLIEFKDSLSANKFLDNTKLHEELKVLCYIQHQTVEIFGVIKFVPPEYSDSDIFTNIHSDYTSITHAKRLFSKDIAGNLVKSNVVVLSFI
jgi:hypothetical protein